MVPLLNSQGGWSVDHPEKQFSLRLPKTGSFPPGGSLPAVQPGRASELIDEQLPPDPNEKDGAAKGADLREKRPAPLKAGDRGKRPTGPLTLSLRAKPLLDRFEDPLGVLVSGSVLPGYAEMLDYYGLTEREAEVLDYLLAGWSIRKTARTLYITERTVKAHITSIYGKTSAANRVELANMLIAGRPVFHERES